LPLALAVLALGISQPAAHANGTPYYFDVNGATPWLRVTKVGNVVTTYYSTNGITYTQAQQHDFSAEQWSSTTCYVGLDMINASAGTPASASLSDVNFMGTASIPEMRIAEFKLTDGAKMNLARP
jgi:hypothetical protein